MEDDANLGRLRYPLLNSFASKTILFSQKTFPRYNQLLDQIKKAYKINVIEDDALDNLFTYQREGQFGAILKNIGLGALNLCRKIFRKEAIKSIP